MTLVAKVDVFQTVITKIKRPVTLAFFCCLYGVLLAGCDPSSNTPSPSVDSIKDAQKVKAYPSAHLVGNTMGTTYSVKVVLEEGVDLEGEKAKLQKNLDLVLAAVNQQMSTYISNSELSRINKSDVGQKVSVSEPLAEILRISLEVYRTSSGAFDVTVGPLVNIWGFGPDEVDQAPSAEAIAKARSVVGMYYLLVDEDSNLTKHKDIYIDLSAIAKGYATDVMAKLLDDSGYPNYMVEIGGELKIKGHNPKGKPWTIGVEKPTLKRSGAVQGVRGNDVAIATSGDYRNYYEKDGERVSHTIDPNTGRPIDHSLASVTVITKSGAYADAYATALNVLGPEKGLALANELDLAAYFIIRDKDAFRVEYTDQFKLYMVDL